MLEATVVSGEIRHENPVHLWHSGPQLAALGRLRMLSRIIDQPILVDHEFENIRSSVDWLLKKQHDHGVIELFLSYLETLEPYLHLRGMENQLVDWCQEGLNACEVLKRIPSQILLILGNAQYSLGEWGQADESWQAAIATSQGSNQVVHARAMAALGRLQVNQGKYKTALKTLAHAEDLLIKINDTESIINVRSEVAAYYLNRRELDKALKQYLEIDEFYKEKGAKTSSDHITLMLGVIYRQKRIFDKALEYLSDLCQRSEAHKNMSGLATGSHHLAWTYFELGDFKEARYLCGKALALYEDLKDPRGLSDTYEQLGAILLEEGQIDDAIHFIDQSIQVRQQIGNDPGSISSLRRLALAHMLKGNRLLAGRLSIRVLIRYMELRILSRHRILALLRDFLVGVTKVTAYDIKGTQTRSVMESFTRTLIHSKKQNQTKNKPDP